MGSDPTTTAAASDTPGTDVRFGALLQALREAFGTRRHATDPRVPRGIKLSARGLVESLRDVGYSLTLEALHAIESGAMLPADGDAFIRAVCAALFLDVPGPEWLALTQQLTRESPRGPDDEEV